MPLKPLRTLFVTTMLLLGAACGSTPTHGVITPMSVASTADWKACAHGVPAEVCVRCRPERAPKFKERGDWCPEHDVPESQCLKCHPDLDFSPPKKPPAQADVAEIASEGADLADLEAHLVAGKVTVFDFYAAWCPPCRKVDEHLYPRLAQRKDIAVRKINVGSWDSPVAERWLGDVAELPFLIIYGRDGRRLATIAGAKLEEIDRALDEGTR
jgi:thiol-disulfide isomerase/thioredoxin